MKQTFVSNHSNPFTTRRIQMKTKSLLASTLGLALFVGTANAVPITVDNFSFEADENTSSAGGFANGERLDFGGQLTSWISQSGANTFVAVGWKDIVPSELDPSPAVGGQESQALSLIETGSVLNTTGTAWSSLTAGDKLTLTISLGMRTVPTLNWNEETFFGLTDGDFSPSGTPGLSDTVANSGFIANNPATGSQSGDGTFTDVSFEYTVLASDLSRNGNIGILLAATETSGGGVDAVNQSFFDNVRLDLTPVPEPGSLALLAAGGLCVLRRRRG